MERKEITKKMDLLGEMPAIQRSYKDSLFKALSKYSPLSSRLIAKEFQIPLEEIKEDKIISMPLENGIFKDVYNDACLQYEDHFIILIEQQSVIDHNIALRMLIYLSETFKRDNLIAMHRSNNLKVLAPKLFIVYNGGKPWKAEIKFSDMYDEKAKNIEGLFDFSIKVVDINRDSLSEEYALCLVFADFIKLIERYKNDPGYNLVAIEREIVTKYPFMKKFFKTYERKELFEMISVEDLARRRDALIKEEGIEEGMEKGIEQGIEQTRKNMIKKFIKANPHLALSETLTGLSFMDLTESDITLIKTLLSN